MEAGRDGHRVPGSIQRDGIRPDRTLELRLFHHFSFDTYKALIRKDSQDAHFLQIGIPKLALSNDFLLDTIMALSALHLEYLESSARKSWLRTGLDYQDRALPAFNKALSEITPSNCEAVTICAMLMIVLVLAIPGVADGSDSSDPVSEILGLRNLLHGIGHIVLQSLDVIHSGGYRSFIMPLPPPEPVAGSLAGSPADEMERLRSEALVKPLCPDCIAH